MARDNTPFLFQLVFISIYLTHQLTSSSSGQSTVTSGQVKWIQSYTVFTDENCKGEHETFIDSVKNLEDRNTSKLGYLGLVKSRKIQNGVWIEIQKTEKVPSLINGNTGSTCLNTNSTDGTYKQIKSIRRAGASDLDQPGLSLFTQPNFGGDELYFEGVTLRLPNTYLFRSWGSTGGVGWTLYRNMNIYGQATCLIPMTDDKANFYHVDYEMSMKSDLYMGSLYQGCWTPLQPPPYYHNGMQMKSIPGIILFDLNNKEVFTNGRDLRLPIPISITSYTFTGRIAQNWTIYETDDENSRYKCLHNVVNSSTPPEHVLIYEQDVIQIRRVRKGCDSDPTPKDGNKNWNTTIRSNSGVKLNNKNFKVWMFLLYYVIYFSLTLPSGIEHLSSYTKQKYIA